MARSVRIVGRGRERGILLATVRAVSAGSKRAAALIGNPGIGKTTLLHETRRLAEREGFVTGAVRAPAVAGVPNAPLLPVLAELRRDCARLGLDAPRALHAAIETMSGRGSVDPDAIVPLATEGLERVARRSPVAVFVDDWHRAPPERRDDLLGVLRAVDAPILFATTLPDAERAALPDARADLWVDVLEVGGLGAGDAAELASRWLGAPLLPSLADVLGRVTMTNPLYIQEVLRSWMEEGVLIEIGGHWGVQGERSLQPPSSLASLLAARVSMLEEVARTVARTIAIVGRDLSFEDVLGVTGVAPDELVRVLGTVTDAGVIEEIEGPPIAYRVAHPSYERALLEGMSATARALLHQRIYQGLRARQQQGHPITGSEIASHALLALERPPDLDALVRSAAREAEAAGGLTDAARWWEHAVRLATGDPARAVALRGQAAAMIGFDARAAVALLTDALGIAGDLGERRAILMKRAEAHRVAGAIQEAIVDLEHTLVDAEDAERFTVRDQLARLNAALGRLDRAEAMFHELEVEQPGGAGYVRVMAGLASVRYGNGDIDGAGTYLARASTEADAEARARIQGNDMWIRFITGDWDAAKRMSDSLVAAADRSGDLWNMELPLSVGARIQAWRGEIATALDLARRAVRVAERVGNPADLVDAHEALTIALLEAGAPAEAVGAARMIERLVDLGIESRPDLALSFVVAGEAYLAAGDTVAARAMAERARDSVAATHWGIAVDRLEAEVRLRLRDRPAAFGWVTRWLEQPSGLVFEQARVHEVAARALFLMGQRADGAAYADQAMERYRALEVLGRVERFERVVATHRPRRVGRPRSDLPGGLTQRETEVLHLVLQGLTNPQIAEVLTVSVHTAKKHVENIIGKAGVHRRTELLAFAERAGIRATLEPQAT